MARIMNVVHREVQPVESILVELTAEDAEAFRAAYRWIGGDPQRDRPRWRLAELDRLLEGVSIRNDAHTVTGTITID